MPGSEKPNRRDWERERRERLNKSFFELSCLLPDHDPTLPLSKIDIITKATSYIKHLQEQNMKLMENSENSDTQIKEVMQLKLRISDLLLRIRQLAELLQIANIPIPAETHPVDINIPMKKPVKWSGRLRQDAAKELLENLQKRREESEKQKKEKQLINKAKMKSKSVVLKKKAKSKKISATLSSVANNCFIKDQNVTAVPQVLNVDLNLSSHLNTSTVLTPLREINNPLPPNKVTDCVTAYSKTITLPCTTTVSIVISNSKPDQIVTVAKSNILTAPIMATGIQPVLERNPALTNLGPGTLILPDGRIMPVPGPQTQTVLQAPTQYIVNRPINPPAVIVMQNIGTTLKPSLPQKSQRLLVPKPKCKDSTKTTFVNKVPIPSISTQQPISISVNNSISTTNPSVVKCENKNNKKAQIKSVKSKTLKLKHKSSDANENKNKIGSKALSKVNNVEKTKINSKNPTAPHSRKDSACELSKSERTDGRTPKRTNNSSRNFVSKRVKTMSQKHKKTENKEAVNGRDKLREDISCKSGKDNGPTTVSKSNSDVQAENRNEAECDKQKEQSKEADTGISNKPSQLKHVHNDSDIVVSRNTSSNNSDTNTVCSNNSNIVEMSVICKKPDNATQPVLLETDKVEEGEKSVIDKQVGHNQQHKTDEKVIVNKECSVKSNNSELNKHMVDNNSVVKISGLVHNNDQIINTDKVHHDYYSDNHKSSIEAGVSSFVLAAESNKQNCTSAVPVNEDHHTNFISLNGNLTQAMSKPSDMVNVDKAIVHTINSEVRIGNKCNTQASNSVSTDSNTDEPLDIIDVDKTIQDTSLLIAGDKNTEQQISGEGDKNTCCVSDLIHSDKHSLSSSGILQISNQQTNFGTSKVDNSDNGTVVTHPAKDTRQCVELNHRNKDIKQNNGSGQFNNLMPLDKVQQNVYVDTRHGQVLGLIPGQNMAQSDKITQQVASIMNMNADKSNQIAVNSELATLQFNKVSKQIDHISKITQASDLIKTGNSGHGSVNLNSSKESGQIINLTSTVKVNNNQINNETDTTQKMQTSQENIFRDSTQNRDRNSFIPVNHSCMDDVRLSLPHSEFSNDLFTSLQVPSTGQHPESISPTAAFLLSFPLVSTSKTSEMLVENDNSDSQHATPTTILQIGNIDPPGTELYHTASPIIMDNSINTFHNLKPKNNGNKNNESTKQHLKSVENFDRYQQQFDISERYQDSFQGNQNFPHSHSANETNCKQRKVNFLLNQEQEMYTACNKKKNSERVCSYSGQTNTEICAYPEKLYERMEFHHSENITQETTNQSENQKKPNSLPLLNSTGVQNTYTQSSYSLFPSSNDYPLGISSQYTTAQPTIETTKSLQPPSNFSILPWTCSTTTSSSLNHNDYVSLYTSFPQSIHNKNQNFPTAIKNNSQKSQICDNRMKDKSVSTGSSKFSANFQFPDQSVPRQQQDVISSHYQTNDVVSSYKADNKNKKPKSLPRPPVNWMTAPDIRPVLPDHAPTPIIPDVMFPPQKDIDFTMPQTNSVLNSCSNIPSFNISTSISNTSQTFYSNSHFSGLDIPLDLPPLPEITTNTSKPHRSLNNAANNHHYSWSPSKSTMPSLLPHIDNHNLMIPSTLPTLVGDLALGTNTGPSTPAENGLKNFNLPNTFPQTNENTNKKFDSRQQEPRKIQGKSPERDSLTASNSDRRNSNRNVPDYCNKTHSHQSTNTSGSFLSVSQLVDHAKSEGRNVSRRVNKQSQANKQTLQKRNSTVQQQTEKQSTVNKNGHSVNYSTIGNMNNVQRKTDINYNDDRNMGIHFAGSFPCANHIPSSTGLWNNNEKLARNPTGGQYKGGSYSAESLIGVNQEQDNITDIPGSFPMANQYNSHYSQPQKSYIDSSIVCSTNNYSSDFSHQNLQHSDFSHQQTQHTYQNCFNFSTQNSIYTSTNTAPFINDNDYQIALDPSYVFHHPVTNLNKSHNQACQTTLNNKDTHRQVTHSTNSKRSSANNKRRDDYSSMGTNQTTPFLQSSDIYQPTHYSNTCRSAVSSSYQPATCITSSPPHHGTTTLTNFNLSTIFPEINDKRAVSGANTFHGNNKHSDSSTTSVQPSLRNEFVPPTDAINTQLPPIRTEFNNILSNQQPVVSLNQQVPSSHFTVEGFSNIPPPFQVHQ